MNRLVEVFCATQRHQKRKKKKTETQTKVRMAFLRPHLCAAVDSMCRKPCVPNCSNERARSIQRECPTSTLLYSSSSINRLYAQNPVFKIVHDESVKVYLHMYNGNVQQNPLCVEFCVTKDFSIYPQLSPTMFDLDANSVLLRAHLCTAVDYMRRKPWVRNCSRERKSLYNGNVQQNTLCAASCVTKDVPISPRFSPMFFYRRANPAPYSAPFFIHSSPS